MIVDTYMKELPKQVTAVIKWKSDALFVQTLRVCLRAFVYLSTYMTFYWEYSFDDATDDICALNHRDNFLDSTKK